MGYAVSYYETLFRRAMATALAPLGVSEAMLHDGLTRALPVPQVQKQIRAPQPYWGPLFAFGSA